MIELRTFVVGDIHGRAKALEQVLDRAKFRFDTDKLITIGDTCDGGRRTKQCFDILLRVKNRVDVAGNHDCIWFLGWIEGSAELPIWVHQGGYNTLYSYNWDRRNVPFSHYNLLKNAKPYYIDEKNRIFVHGGFNPKVPIQNQDPYFIMWDRTLIQYAKKGHIIQGYTHVFVGHTSTQLIRKGWTKPLTFGNLTMTDCGGGWNGRLALINVDDLSEYYLSDIQKPDEDDDGEYPDTEEAAW